MMELPRPSASAISSNWQILPVGRHSSQPDRDERVCPSIGLKVAETYKLELVVL
jgi:hypothetical protein